MAEAHPPPDAAEAGLDGKSKIKWRTYANRLERPLLEALTAEGAQRRILLLTWAASKEPEMLDDEVLAAHVVAWVLSLRPRLLQELVSRYSALLERDSARNREIQLAARAFNDEFAELAQWE